MMTTRKQKQHWDQLNQQIVGCSLCPRLVEYCGSVAATKRKSYSDWEYWGKPVPNLGDPAAKILLVGLAPAAHGANRTGRMFTGDRSGDFLFEALHAVGLCNQPGSTDGNDGLKLTNCAITAICHCAPPANKPTVDELANCQEWLGETIQLGSHRVFVALGQMAWTAMLRFAFDQGWIQNKKAKFGHATELAFSKDSSLLGCYHPSQQNTFTGKLTQKMLRQVLQKAILLSA